MTNTATLAMVNLDCDRPRALAEFYHRVLGWEITHSTDEYAMISGEGAPIGFGRVEGYRPPAWPDTASGASRKRFHLDLSVADLDAAEARCLEFGAAKPEFQPGGDRWRVLIDPAGHPFCVCAPPQGQ